MTDSYYTVCVLSANCTWDFVVSVLFSIIIALHMRKSPVHSPESRFYIDREVQARGLVRTKIIVDLRT